MSQQSPILTASNLHIGFYQATKPVKLLTQSSNLSLYPDTFTCLLGPNGSGKSTLIRTLAGLQKSLEGEVKLADIPINKIPLKRKAFLLGMVLTERPATANLTVEELVAMGRYPYTGFMGRLSEEDIEKTEEAINLTQLSYLRKKKIWQLSDGERQKAMIARALAQDTPLIILDEPTAHLDLNNRVELMYLLKELSHQLNKAVLLSTHDLDIALQCADKFWLMQPCKKIVDGIPEDLVLKGEFENTFNGKKFKFEPETGSFKLIDNGNMPIQLKGNGISYYWTKHALERNGYKISDENCTCLIEIINQSSSKTQWKLHGHSQHDKTFNTIEEVLVILSNYK